MHSLFQAVTALDICKDKLDSLRSFVHIASNFKFYWSNIFWQKFKQCIHSVICEWCEIIADVLGDLTSLFKQNKYAKLSVWCTCVDAKVVWLHQHVVYVSGCMCGMSDIVSLLFKFCIKKINFWKAVAGKHK